MEARKSARTQTDARAISRKAFDQNFREFSLMPGPMVLDSTAERI